MSITVSPTELGTLFDRWNGYSNNTDNLNYEYFEKLFLETLPWWRHGVEEVFKMLDKKRAGVVEISDFVATVSTIVKGTTEERLQCKKNK